MEKFEIIGSFESPHIYFEPEKGIYKIEGRCIHEDPKRFYGPVLKWMDDHPPADGKEKATLKLFLYYFNTSSAKYILDILKRFDQWFENGTDIRAIWQYEEGDDSALDDGHDFKRILKMPFEIVEVEEPED